MPNVASKLPASHRRRGERIHRRADLHGDDARGGHEWAIEFEQPPQDLEQFTSVLDHTMRALNSDYDAKRSTGLVLRSPVVHAMPKGSFHGWLKERGKLGGQNKVPRLCNDRVILEQLLLLAKA
jgi:hypothetical protein